MSTTYAKPISMPIKPQSLTSDQKKKHREKLKKLYEEERQIVKGRFLCFEPRGGSVSFCYKKFEWEQPTQYNFHDGEEYEIPLGVARHLNGIDAVAEKLNGNIHTCSYPVNQYKLDDGGKASIDVGKRTRRYAFQTLSGETLG